MNPVHAEFNEVRMSIINGTGHEERAERISQLTFAFVRELLERELQHLGADVVIDLLRVPPLQVSLDAMSEEAVARASAESIYRALLAAL